MRPDIVANAFIALRINFFSLGLSVAVKTPAAKAVTAARLADSTPAMFVTRLSRNSPRAWAS